MNDVHTRFLTILNVVECEGAITLESGEAADSSLGITVILDALEAALHERKSEWIFLRELRVGTGLRNSSAQRLDAFALNCLPHLGMKRVCYEIKLSRGDFLCEMRHPLKRRIGLRYSNEFYFVSPAGVLSIDEIPVECGLIEIGLAQTDESKHLVRSHQGFFHIDPSTCIYCLVAVPAPWRDTQGPTWQLTATIVAQPSPLSWRKPAGIAQTAKASLKVAHQVTSDRRLAFVVEP